ncbi:MAG: hypothetical protein IPF99_36120 [Deltaproteobacteria bacterium]|nr:hypothetical protein [Deltaproteobacteria bacterium]
MRTYRYDAAGALLEVADSGQAERYVYDPAGHLRFVRSYVATDGAWSLATEVEIEATADGGDLTWALDPYPYETWRRDRYRR